MLAIFLASAAFTSPLAASRPAVLAPRTMAPQAIGSFFGGGGNDFQLIPSDVQFKDVDGDTVTFRPISTGKADFYVNGKLQLSKAVVVKNGDMLEITGTIIKGTPFSAIGFNLEDVVTEGTKPLDPADCDKVMEALQ